MDDDKPSAECPHGQAGSAVPAMSTERSSMDDVLDVYKRGLDLTLIRQRAAMTVQERFDSMAVAMRQVEEVRRAGSIARGIRP